MLYVLLKYGIYVGIQLIITIMVTMQSIIIAYSALVILISYPFLIPRKYIIYITGNSFRNLLMSKQEEKRTLDFLSYLQKEDKNITSISLKSFIKSIRSLCFIFYSGGKKEE